MIDGLVRWFLVRPLAWVISHLWRPLPRRRRVVLRLRIAGRLTEALPRTIPFMPVSAVLVGDVTSLLRDAAREPNVVGIRIDVGRVEAGMAKVQEIRRAIHAVRAAGRYVHVHLDGGGQREYLIACAADRVSMAPLGTLDLVGLRGETTYLGGVFAALGIHPDFEAVGDYKAFAERFVRTGPTPAARRNTEAIFGDVWEQMVDAVAGGRGLEPGDAARLLGSGPWGADEAMEAGLVDEVLYADRVRRSIRDVVGKHRTIKAGRYGSRRRRVVRWRMRASREPMVAVVPAVGQIMPGTVGNAPGNVIAARTLIRQLDAVRKNPRVAAVVLRIDSPGGSAEASDLIWRSVQRLVRKKPVVASMGDVAASGGYYIAMGCNAVLAEPGTLTGSIGVVGGKLNLGGLYEKLGVHRDVVGYGEHHGFYATTTDFSSAERQRLRARMDSFYREFVGKAARGRGLEPEVLEPHARGRVWTGRQALERRLVDGMGSLHDAAGLAAELASLPQTPALVTVSHSPVPLWWPGRWSATARVWLAERIPSLAWIVLPELRTHGLMARLPFDIRFL